METADRDRPRMVKIGCCGFAKARAKYFEAFRMVEVQKTFYQPPRMQTLERWRAEAPDGFEYTLKAWQPVTHPPGSPTWRRIRHPPEGAEDAGFFRPTPAVGAAWRLTREAAGRLGAGVVVFQCPASFTPEAGHVTNMRRFFREAERGGLRFVWEPRGEWRDKLVARLCEELELIHCVDPLKQAPATSGTGYFRLHGPEGYRSRYGEDDLRRLLAACARFDEAYCLFNNMTMFDDAARLAELAARAG